MPRSATGATEVAATGGFTLVELLVVLVIAGIVTGLVALRLGSIGSDDPERLVRNLELRLEAMCDRALLTGNLRGMHIDRDGYSFWQREGGRWIEADAPTPLTWPAGLNVDLEIDGLAAVGSDTDLPQVLCSGLEPASAFRLRLSRGERRAELVWPQ